MIERRRFLLVVGASALAFPLSSLAQRPAGLKRIINRKTAQQMRLTIPPILLARADKVIE